MALAAPGSAAVFLNTGLLRLVKKHKFYLNMLHL